MEDRTGSHDLRPLVALVFLPGLYLSLLISALVAVASAALLIGLVGWLASQINLVPTGIIFALGLGGLYGVWVCISAGWRSIQRATVLCRAVHLSRDQAPAFWNMLDDLSRGMGCPLPDHVLVEFGSSFFVTEANVRTFAGSVTGRTLCISAPFLHLLNPEELKAVLAHEFAHFTGQDTIYSRRFYPVYRGTTSALQQIHAVVFTGSESSGITALPLLIPAFILARYLGWFSGVESRISRQRETRADEMAAEIVGRDALGTGLAKLYAFSPIWERAAERWIVAALNEGKAFDNLSVAFAERFRGEADLLNDVIEEASAIPSHPTDSHPTLSERLENLGFTEDVLFECTKEHTAASLFADLQGIESDLTIKETALIASCHPDVDREAVARAASSAA
jgi:Zn-dependent protease with chaperone function